MKIKLLPFILILVAFQFYGQCPTAPLIINTQAEIDNFATNYPNCSILTEELRINGANNTISNLNGLSQITDAQKIFVHSTEIIDFSGLDNLVTAEHLSIWFNGNILNLNGLSVLESLESLELYINNALIDVSGAPNLQYIGNLTIYSNTSFSDLSQFNFITSLGNLTLGNNALTSLGGLQNLQTIEGDLVLSELLLENYDELSVLDNIQGSLYLMNNPQVQDVSVFSNINILQDLFLLDCPNLTDLSGLENIQIVGGTLRIGIMEQLTDLSVFSNLLYVGNLDIYENNSLQSLSGFESLQEIDQTLHILNNPLLNNIESLNGVSTSEIAEVVVSYNHSLSSCTTDFMCTVVNDPSITKYITENSLGCSSVEEIQKECLLGNEDISLSNYILMLPNPVSHLLQVHISNSIELKSVSVYSMLGQKLSETNQKVVDLSNLASGVYFVEVDTNRGILSKRVVKN